MNNPRNFTLNLSYAEIKPERTDSNSLISSLISNSEGEGEVSDNNNNVKKSLFIDPENSLSSSS